MEYSSPTRWLALASVSILSLVVFVDFTIVNTILPAIQRELNATVDELQWMMNSFILMLVAFMVTAGRFGDLFGRRKVLYAGVIVFALASFLAGTAQDPAFLIACRFAQGIAAAIPLTCGTSLITHHFPENERGRALAIFMSITGFGMAVGPIIGGLFVSLASWRWAFYVNVPVVIIGFALALRSVEETPPQTGEKIDWLGLALFTPGMIGVVTYIMKADNWGWFSALSLTIGIGGMILLAGFVLVERRVEFPIIDFNLFRIPQFLAANVTALAIGSFIGIGVFMAPLYLQMVRDEHAYIAGLMLLPISGLVVLVPPLIGGLSERIGVFPFLIAGQVLMTASALVQVYFEPDSPVIFVLFGLGLFGFGWGLLQATSAHAATSALPAAASGLAIGVLYTVWNIGSSVALALGGQLFQQFDKASFNGAIASENIVLSDKDRVLVQSVLSDPSEASKLLGKLTPGLEDKMIAIFNNSFMDGYAAAMWFLVATSAAGAIVTAVIVSRIRPADDTPEAES